MPSKSLKRISNSWPNNAIPPHQGGSSQVYPSLSKNLALHQTSHHPPTHFFFQKFTDAQFEQIQLKYLEQQHCEEKKDQILCKICQHGITSQNRKIEVNGRHQHIFSNPLGISYEIGCFSAANRCVNKGTASLEYTWFKGFIWRFALCSNCYAILGWFYQS